MPGGVADAGAPRSACAGPAGGNGSGAWFGAVRPGRHSGGVRPGMLRAGWEVDRKGQAKASLGVLRMIVAGGPAEGNGPRARFRAATRSQHSGGTRPHGWARTHPPGGGRARPGLLSADRGVNRRTGARALTSVLRVVVEDGPAEGNGSRTRFRAAPWSQHSGGTRTPGWVRTHPPGSGRARPGLLWADRGVDRRTGARALPGDLRVIGKVDPREGNGSRSRFLAAPPSQRVAGTRPPAAETTRSVPLRASQRVDRTTAPRPRRAR